MNDDLNTSLHRAVDAVLDEATPAETMRRSVAERIRAKHRRRPALIIGSTLGSLALVGGTAFAAVQLTGDDDRPHVPDLIGSQRPQTTPAPTPSTGATTTPTPSPSPTPAPTFPVADPSAVFPACGAVLDPPAGRPDLSVGPFADGPLGTTFSTEVWGSTSADLRGELSAEVTLVAVKDGVVVGSSLDTGTSETIPLELGRSDGLVSGGTGHLAHTLCTDDTAPLPTGRYSVWASTGYTITERIPYDENFVAQPAVTTPETGTTLDQVASLWMGPDGVPTAHPGITPGWPQNLDEATAFSGAQTEPESVVWIQTSEHAAFSGLDPTLVPVRDRVADLGYLWDVIPFACQGQAPTGLGLGDDPALVERYGIGLVFLTRAEAETFVSLWEPLHGPVAGIVTDTVACHFS